MPQPSGQPGHGTRPRQAQRRPLLHPEGPTGRPSKSLTLDQARALRNAAEAEGGTIGAYVVVSLLTGARTEELRALTWDHVDLDGLPDAQPPVPPSMEVWHSVREGGDAKTKRSRRTLALPQRCVDGLRTHRGNQDQNGLVFATSAGTELDAANVRRAFRRVTKAAGLSPADGHPATSGTASCPCSRMTAYLWRPLPTWSATLGPR